jgi:citrate lyase subunit beta/citryl-CoA lyase
MRSWLLTPCRSEAEFSAARTSGADFVIVDFVAAPRAPEWLAAGSSRGPRIAAQVGAAIENGLDAFMPFAPWGILAACQNGVDVQRLGGKLAVREARFGLELGATRILARLDDAKGILNLASFAGASPRLAALLFDASGPSTKLARSLVALAAAAADVVAIDGAGDQSFFRDEAARARNEGYSGKIATTLEEVEILNAIFTAA